jgi:CRP-like cAMP-binding protein
LSAHLVVELIGPQQELAGPAGVGEVDDRGRDGDTIVNVLSPGDAFGEMAFLLERPRSFDVDAATAARVLSLSEGALRAVIADDANIAAKLLLNLSRMLCVRLIRAS